MFCSQCGERISEKAKYCQKCGASVQHGEEIGTPGETNEVENVSNIISNIDQALPIYRKIANLSNQIQQLSMQLANVGVSSHHASPLLVLIGVVMLCLFGMIFNLGMVIGLMNYGLERLVYYFNGGLIAVAVTFGVGKNAIKRKKLEKKIKNKEKELSDYVKSNQIDALYFLSENYRYFMAANYIKECFINGRAKRLAEALNLYEEQLHRWKMENYQQQILQVNIQQAYLIQHRI